MQSTDKMVIINGMSFRIWQGSTERGTKFVALVNRLAGASPEAQSALVAELGKDHVPVDPAMALALPSLDPSINPGIVEPPAKGTPQA